MKTIKKICCQMVFFGVILISLVGMVYGQMSPSGQRGISMPQNVTNLLWGGKVDSAIVEFEAFKKIQASADPYHLLYVEMTVYRDAQIADAANAEKYKIKYDALLQQILKKYPDRSDTYLLQITPESTPEQIVDLTTKAINADPTNLGAYQMRSNALYQLGKTAEAEADALKARGM